MPKRITEYGITDWAHLRPLLHAYKTTRYRMIRAAYLARPARDETGSLQKAIRGRRVLVTIGFDDPEIVGRQLLAIQRCIADVVHVVADNSLLATNAAANRALCDRSGVAYLRLPDNPWSRRAPSRSHGLALDWVYARLIVPGEPRVFGFLDQDLVPIATCDPFEPLSRQPVHGDKRWAGPRWFLWAGYCFFRTEALRGKRIDFGQDWFAGLDTGGGNWPSLYAGLDPRSLEERPIEAVPALPGIPVSDCYFERRGTWLHEVGLHGRPALKSAKRGVFLRLLDEHGAAPRAGP